MVGQGICMISLSKMRETAIWNVSAVSRTSLLLIIDEQEQRFPLLYRKMAAKRSTGGRKFRLFAVKVSPTRWIFLRLLPHFSGP